MRVLVLTVTAGEGHNSQGRALIKELEERGHIGYMHDYFKNIDNIRAKFANDIYFWALKNFPSIGRHSYEKIEERDVRKKASKLCTFSIMMNSKKAIEQVVEVIDEFKPDFIFASHVYTASLMARFKEEGKYLDIPTFFTVNDYVPCPYTEMAKSCEYILTPNEDFNDRLLEMGYKKEQILPFGIVADTKFSKKLDRNEIRKKLGLDLNTPVFYLSSGGIGFGDTLETIQQLEEIEDDFTLIIANAHNTKMFEKINEYLKEEHRHKILNYQFVNNVEELMSCSDAILGKIGGTTLMESFNIGLPLICLGQPPFQEAASLKYLIEHESILNAKDYNELKTIVKNIVTNPNVLNNIKQNIAKLAKPNVTKDFVDFMEKLYKEKQK